MNSSERSSSPGDGTSKPHLAHAIDRINAAEAAVAATNADLIRHLDTYARHLRQVTADYKLDLDLVGGVEGLAQVARQTTDELRGVFRAQVARLSSVVLPSPSVVPGGSAPLRPQTHPPSSWGLRHADSAVRNVAADLGLSTLARLRGGPPSWIYVGRGASDPVIIRLIAAPDGNALLERTRAQLDLIATLRERGAQLVEPLGPPQQFGSGVAAVTRYLPSNAVSYKDFGVALASLHNAGAAPDVLTQLEPFDPLKCARSTLAWLREACAKGRPFRAGGATFPPELLTVFQCHLDDAEEATSEALNLCERRGYSLTTLHNDVHPGNVRGDDQGRAVLLDLDAFTQGPAEYDLGRPVGQWEQRFARPPVSVSELLRGYEATLNRPVDPELLTLCVRISDVRFGTSMISTAVAAAAVGMPPDAWSFNEGVQRMANLHDPKARWNSREARITRHTHPTYVALRGK